MKQIIPLGSRVLIQPIAAEQKTEGGIIIPTIQVRNLYTEMQQPQMPMGGMM